MTNLLILICASISFFLALITYFRNRQALKNTSFALLSLSLALWSYAFFFYLNPVVFSSLFWIKVVYLMVFGMIGSMFYFSFAFPNEERPPLWSLVLYFLVNFPILGLLFGTNLFVVDVVSAPDGIDTKLGPLYFFVVAFWMSYMVVTIYKLIKNFRKSEGVVKMQFVYILLGLSIFYLGSFIFDALIPILFHTTKFFALSTVASMVFVVLSAYAIIRHRLMDVRVAAQEAIIFLIKSTVIFIIGFVGAYFFGSIYGIHNEIAAIPVIIVVSLFVTFIFENLTNVAKYIAGNFLFQSVYDYEKTLQEISTRLSTVVETEKLTEILCANLSKILKLDQIAILIWNARDKKFHLSYDLGLINERKQLLENNNFLHTYFKKYPNLLVFDEINSLISESNSEEIKQELNHMYQILDQIQMGLVLPLSESGSVDALVFLGNKASNNPYSVQDINLLNTIASQASLALANTQLYQQIFDLNKDLEQKVKEETEELYNKNQDLQKAYQELKSLDTMKDQLIAITSHELKSPLSIAKNYLWSVINQPEPQTNFASRDLENLTRAMEGMETLVKLVNTILDVSKIEAGKLILAKQKIKFSKVDEIISKVLDEFEARLKASNLKVSLNLPKDSNFSIIADPVRLEEVLTNLISNAIHYTTEGDITITASRNGNNATFSVADTGRGVAKEHLPHLFEKFYREDTSLTASNAQTGGTGLGLYITKSLVEIMGGSINVESQEGKGSIFTFSLPLEN